MKITQAIEWACCSRRYLASVLKTLSIRYEEQLSASVPEVACVILHDPNKLYGFAINLKKCRVPLKLQHSM